MRFFIRLSLLLMALTVMTPAWAEETAPPATEPAPPAEDAVLANFFQAKTQEMEALRQDVTDLQVQLDELNATFMPALETAQARLQLLEIMARMVKTNPYDMRVALAEAKFMQKALAKDYLPLENLAKELELKQVTVQSLEEDLERKWAASLGKDLRQDVLAIRKGVTEVGQKIKTTQGQIDKVKVAVDAIQNRVQEWITTFETQLPLIWRAEFLDGAEFKLLPPPGADISKELMDWFANMKTFFSTQYSSETVNAGDWVGTFVLFWLPFVIIGMVSFRFLSRIFENAHAGGRITAALGILSLSFGLSLLAAFLSGKVKQTSFLLACTHIFMLYGVQALAWVFRNVRGVLKHKTLQPLLPLVFLSMSVAVLDLLRLPQWLEHLTWVSLLVLSSLFFGMIQPQLRYERLIRSVHPYILAVFVAMAVLGWGNLAVLTSTLWGVLALAMQLAIGTTSVIRVAVEKMDKTGLNALVADLTMTVLGLLVWAGVAIGVMTWITINLGTNAVVEKLSSMELNWGDFSFNFLRIGVVLLFFQLVRSLTKAWKAIMENEQLRWKNIDHGAAASLQRIGIYCMWLLFILVSLNLLGISLTNFAVIAGGLSVGIGFGMQTMISNFISGLILLFDRSIQAGDVIEINGLWAQVESVNIRNTVVRTYENAKIFVPNSDLIANQVTNWTYRNDVRIRRDIAVGVAYGSDVQLVKKLLVEAAEEHPAVLSAPAPWVIFNNFGASSLDFILRLWVRHVDFSASAPSEIREAIDAKFREAGVEIPFNQMDVHLRPGDGFVRLKNEA
ncbi:MAG: mechanosensitive ion channel [Deltaproteobacteria bacterium]|nr:mechanosensitive ion channel [Deltaproteobacteria bacterium]